MQLFPSSKVLFPTLVALATIYMCGSLAPAEDHSNSAATAAQTKDEACPSDDSGLTLPSGFCATVFADGIGHARHMVVAPDGVLYVNTWSGRYYGNDTPLQAVSWWPCKTRAARARPM